MDYSIYRLNLDVKTNRSQALLKVFKGDTAVRLVCMLTDGGRVFQLKDGNVATITLTTLGRSKPITHACYIRDNSIVYTFTDDTTNLGEDDESGEDYNSGRIEAQLNVYGGVVYDNGKPIYSQTLATPKFSIAVSDAANKPTDPIFAGINDSVGIVLGAAAAENQREYNETVRQDTYTNAITTANEAKGIADKAVAMFDSIGLEYNKQTGHLNFVYTKDGKEERKPVDLPLESTVTDIEEYKDDNGQPYLILKLASGGTSDPIYLDDIFEGFVKTQAKANMLYGTDADKEDTVYPIDNNGAANKGSIVRRTYDNGGIYVPSTPESSNEAASKDYVDKFVPIKPRYNMGKSASVYVSVKGSVKQYQLDYTEDPWDGTNLEFNGERITSHGGCIVQRGGTGEIYVPKEPADSYEAASKYYVDVLGKRVENIENNTIIYDNHSGTESKIGIPPVASPNAVVASIGGLNKKCKNMLPDGYGYYNYSAQWESVGGVDLEEGVTYILDTDDTDLTIDLWYPYDSGVGSEYVEPGIFTAPISGTYNFHVKTNASSSDVGRFRIVKYTDNIPVSRLTKADIKEYLNLKDAKVYELATAAIVNENEVIHNRYYVPSVKFLNARYSLGDGIGAGVDGCNYLDLTIDRLVGNYARIVFTGDEIWNDKTTPNTGAVRYKTSIKNYALPSVSYEDNGNVDFNVPVPAICDSYEVGSITALGKGGYGFAISSTDIYFYDNNFPTVEAWKNYVKRRYASGNPITVVYRVMKVYDEYIKLPDFSYLIDVENGEYIKVLDKDGNLIEAPVSITFTRLRGT